MHPAAYAVRSRLTRYIYNVYCSHRCIKLDNQDDVLPRDLSNVRDVTMHSIRLRVEMNALRLRNNDEGDDDD